MNVGELAPSFICCVVVWVMERYPPPCQPLSLVHSRPAGPVPCLSSTVSLALMWVRPAGSECRVGDLALISACYATGLSRWRSAVDLVLVVACGRAGGLSNSAVAQMQIQGCELGDLSIYFIYELPEVMKEPLWQIQSCRAIPRGILLSIQF